ncbi:MAG: (Fe-S)-binding protein, partial [Gemmatimonadetes bacterium]|nr:(Fe-S)-binding protein [Gemmatimonadota bacterium]
MLENVIDVTERCRHSLMCRHVCPVGNITRMETLTPHGWAQLVALERRGLSTWNAQTVDALYKCADCGNCRTHCVYSNPLPEGIAAARAVVAEKGLALPSVYELGKVLQEWENPYAQQRPVAAQGTGEVALFVGDEIQHLRPRLLDAALKLLGAVGIRPVLIGRGRSNGYLPSSLGLPGIATDLAVATLAELKASGAKRLVVLSPGDFFAFGILYDERLGLRLPDGVELVNAVSYLAEQHEAGNLKLNGSSDATAWAYVDPTHSVRVEGRFEGPRRLLSAVLPGAPKELFWRDGRAYPTGETGGLEFTQPQIADGLTQARLADAANAGANGVITESAASLYHMERHAGAYNLRVAGLYELLADQLVP